MTPAARLASAALILDRYLAGMPAEQALTNWARGNRYAGSGDRAAIRDLVFDAIRCRRSHAALARAETGRGLMLGRLRDHRIDPDALFTGDVHALAKLTADERETAAEPLAPLVALDCPDWLAPLLNRSLEADFSPVLQTLRTRAPVFLRVNTLRSDIDSALVSLARDGVQGRPHPLAATAIEVVGNARKLRTSQAYLRGHVEFQDAASQAVVEALPISKASRVLDYCAGGGGKSLAIAARSPALVVAHDADPARMRDLPVRALRSGAPVTVCETQELQRLAPFDLVLVDAPCSGSGSWRRAPEAKWALTPERLYALCALQIDILDRAVYHVESAGYLAYVTCSLIDDENEHQVAAFLERHPEWSETSRRRFTPLDGGDGFFVAVLRRD